MSNAWGKCMARNFGMLLAFLAVLLAGSTFLPSSCQGMPPKQVLVMHSYHVGYKWTNEITQGITAALRDEGKAVQIRYEYMDTKRVSDPSYFELLYETYRYKFRSSRFDVIIATDNDAFDFLKRYRDELFPATPVVFCGVNYFEPSQLEGKKLFTGVNEAADIKATLDLALRLHPATRQIVVINDETSTGRIVNKEVESLVPAYQGRVRFKFLKELEMPEILDTVRKLGPDSLVFYSLFFRDKAGRFYEYDEGITLIAESSPVPVYGVWNFYLDYGLVGGMLTSGYFQGETAGRMALRILRGEKVGDIPVVMKSPNRYMFDYRQLKRFHIDTSALPAESIVINRPSSLYSVPRQVFWGAVAALVGSVLIISLLLYNTAIRRRAERDLRNAAVKYRIVADNTYNWEFWLDPEWNFLYTSPSCQRITGHTAGEFQADPGLLHRIIHPDDAWLLAGHRHDSTGKPVMGKLEIRIVRQDGEFRWIQHVCLPVFDDDGRFLGTRASNSDITERKLAEERNLQLAGIVESSDDAIIGKTLDGTITSWNKGAEKIFGYTEEEVIGNPVIMLVPPEHREEVSLAHDKIRSGERIEHFETVRTKKDGERIYISLTYSPVLDRQGKVVALSTIGRDITEHKKAEEALRESEQKYRQLSEALEQRAKEMVDELRQKDKMLIIQSRQAVMGEMISNIAHQWRQPLNMLGLLAQELQMTQKMAEFSREFIEDNVRKTLEIIRQMSKTIDDFRYFFRSDAERVDFTVSEAIEKTLSLLEGSFKVHGIQTEVIRTGDPVINGYPSGFVQVLLNILINARDALTARNVGNPTISITLFTQDSKTVVSIADNAGGIPEDIIDKVFEPYFSTKGPEQGTGIGLFMCKTIIEKNMNGRLSVRNVGDGAEFRIEV